MKKTIITLFLLVGLIAISASAQDFSNPKIQFMAFSFGVPVGYDLDTGSMVAGSNFGIKFAVIEKLMIGYDNIKVGTDKAVSLLRLSFSFTDLLGTAIGFGGDAKGSVAELGFYGNFFQSRAASGLAYGLGMRLDYLTKTDDFGKGKLLFIINASFGL